MTENQIAEVETKIENKEPDVWHTFGNDKQQALYNFLRRGVEYVLAPSIVGRITEIESLLPDLVGVAKVANPTELNAPPNTFWILTAINASSVGDKYEVTREYTLSYATWDDVELLYT